MENQPCISAIRGAIQLRENTPQALDTAACKVFHSLLTENSISEYDLAAILITQTSDLTSKNGAAALRSGGYATHIPLFCMQEAQVDGMMDHVLRFLLILNKPLENSPVHVYLDGAERLRPDIKKGQE